MNTDEGLLEALGRANPVLDPEDLVDSYAASELAMRKHDSVLDWRAEGNDYIADGYRIRLRQQGGWEMSLRGAVIGSDESLKDAFGLVEHHRRRALRRRDLRRYALTFVLAVMAGGVIVGVVDEVGELFLWGAFVLLVFIALRSLARINAAWSGNPYDPYRRRLPWERRSWGERLLGPR